MMTRTHKLEVAALGLVATLILSGGCGPRPEESSGEDAFRHTAAEIELEQWIPDDVSAIQGDRTDWKSFTVKEASDVIITIVFEQETTVAEVGLYDRYGMPVMEDKKRKSDSPRVILKGQVPPGTNFIKVAASRGNNESGYTLQVAVGSVDYRPPRPF